MIQLVVIALSTFASEDLACIATGVLIAQGRLGWLPGIAACFAGIVAGDVLLYAAGFGVGRPALRFLRRFVSEEKVERASSWLRERGLAVVFISRFTPGLRTATYVAAGMLRTPFLPFLGYFLLAALAWTPLLIASTVYLGGVNRAYLALFVAALFLFRFVKWKRWEFWPMWAAYAPVVPYILWLGIKHRSFTLFTAANPGIACGGGLVGESKSEILAKLTVNVAPFRVITGGNTRPTELPVVLKPDVGERGAGVAVIRTKAEFDAYMAAAHGPVIEQRYVPGVEFGVFYYRYPDEPRGHIYAITEKRFPSVTGDGRRTLRQLIADDSRAVNMMETYARLSKRPLAEVPGQGERVQLVEIGTHCRGAIFLDGTRLRTPALEAAIDRVSQSHPGFYFGRYDVRTESPEALSRGEFTVIELNGVSGEATHIYDPAISTWGAYRSLYSQWRIAFEIGAINRQSGFQPMSLLELWRLVSTGAHGVGSHAQDDDGMQPQARRAG